MDRRVIIERYFATFSNRSRDDLAKLLSNDFDFSGPQGFNMDEAAFIRDYWELVPQLRRHDFKMLVENDKEVIIQVEGDGEDGQSIRNLERFTFDNHLIQSLEVFHGRSGAWNDSRADIVAIETLLDQRQEALRVKDARLVGAKHASDAAVYALAPPLAKSFSVGGLEEWFHSWDGILEWRTKDPKINVCGDLAFVYALEFLGGKKLDGTDVSLWFRTTLGLKKIDNEWLIVHEHQSVPFYMDGTGKAALDLKPGVVFE